MYGIWLDWHRNRFLSLIATCSQHGTIASSVTLAAAPVCLARVLDLIVRIVHVRGLETLERGSTIF